MDDDVEIIELHNQEYYKPSPYLETEEEYLKGESKRDLWTDNGCGVSDMYAGILNP